VQLAFIYTIWLLPGLLAAKIAIPQGTVIHDLKLILSQQDFSNAAAHFMVVTGLLDQFSYITDKQSD
jgi:hypothetical protein